MDSWFRDQRQRCLRWMPYTGPSLLLAYDRILTLWHRQYPYPTPQQTRDIAKKIQHSIASVEKWRDHKIRSTRRVGVPREIFLSTRYLSPESERQEPNQSTNQFILPNNVTSTRPGEREIAPKRSNETLESTPKRLKAATRSSSKCLETIIPSCHHSQLPSSNSQHQSPFKSPRQQIPDSSIEIIQEEITVRDLYGLNANNVNSNNVNIENETTTSKSSLSNPQKGSDDNVDDNNDDDENMENPAGNADSSNLNHWTSDIEAEEAPEPLVSTTTAMETTTTTMTTTTMTATSLTSTTTTTMMTTTTTTTMATTVASTTKNDDFTPPQNTVNETNKICSYSGSSSSSLTYSQSFSACSSRSHVNPTTANNEQSNKANNNHLVDTSSLPHDQTTATTASTTTAATATTATFTSNSNFNSFNSFNSNFYKQLRRWDATQASSPIRQR